MSKIRLGDLYKTVVIIILAAYIVINSSVKSIVGLSFYSFFNYTLIGLMTVLTLLELITYKKIQLYFYFLFLLILMTFWNSTANIQLLLFISLFIILKPIDVIYIYKYGVLLGVATVVFLSLARVISVYSEQGNTYSFGFINENITAFYLILLSILCLTKLENNDLKLKLKFNVINSFFFLLVTFLNFYVFSDNTATAVQVLFFVAVVLNKYLIKNTIFFKFCFAMFPILLASFSIWIGYNFGKYDWMYRLNQLVTLRPFIWHYYLLNYPVGPFSTSWSINSDWVGGAFDGSYVYSLVFNGYVLTSLFTIGLSIANWNLVKYGYSVVLALMIAFEFAGFSENVLFNYYQCFGIIFALQAFNHQWYKNNTDIDNSSILNLRGNSDVK